MNVVVVTIETGSGQVLPAADALALVISDPQTYRLEPPFGTGAYTAEGLLRAFQLATGNSTASYLDLIAALRIASAVDVPLTPIAHLAALNVQAAFAEIVAGDVDRDADIVTALANAAAAVVTANAAGVSATAALALAGAAIASSAIETSGTLASNSDARVPSSKAVRTYVGAALTAIGSLNPLGVINASTNPNYPAANKGDLYFISVAGLIGGGAGAAVGAGDYVVCFVNGSAAGNQATVGANWGVVHFASAIAILSVSNIFTAAQTITLGATGSPLTLTSTDDTAAASPDLPLFRDSATPAIADALGRVLFKGRRSDAASAIYAAACARILAVNAGAESGAFDIFTVAGGAYARRFSVAPLGLSAEGVTGGDKGAGTVNSTGVYENGVLVSEKPFLNTWTGAEPVPARTARSNKDRWSDTIDVMECGADPTGATANFHTVLFNAVEEAKARNCSEIRLPPGLLKFGDETHPCVLVNTAGKPIRTIGRGRATQVTKAAPTGTWIQIDDLSGVTTKGFVFEEFNPIVTDPGGMTAGEVFLLGKTVDIKFRHVPCTNVCTGWTLGVSHGSLAADRFACNYIDLIDCASTQNSAGKAMINIVTGGILNIKGGERWNCGGADNCFFIQGVNPSNFGSWDGLYVYDQFFEAFRKYLTSTGAGISNVIWTGGQCDRADIGFESSGDNDKAWDVSNVQMNNSLNPGLNPPETTLKYPFWLNTKGDYTIRDVKIAGYTGYLNVIPGASAAVSPRVAISGVTFHGSGKNVYTPNGVGGYNPPASGVELIRFGGAGDDIQGCRYIVASGIQAAKFGVQWMGTGGLGHRGESNNRWTGLTSTNTNGAV